MNPKTCLQEWHDHESELKHADSVECAVEITCHGCGDTGVVHYHDEL